MSKYYNTCEYCGANLDPCEACDCCRNVAKTNGAYKSFRPSESSDELYTIVLENGEELPVTVEDYKEALSNATSLTSFSINDVVDYVVCRYHKRISMKNNDLLMIGYDSGGNDKDVPTLVISRIHDNKQEVIKSFCDDKAQTLYQLLTDA